MHQWSQFAAEGLETWEPSVHNRRPKKPVSEKDSDSCGNQRMGTPGRSDSRQAGRQDPFAPELCA